MKCNLSISCQMHVEGDDDGDDDDDALASRRAALLQTLEPML